jgi:hypothetical protein
MRAGAVRPEILVTHAQMRIQAATRLFMIEIPAPFVAVFGSLAVWTQQP